MNPGRAKTAKSASSKGVYVLPLTASPRRSKTAGKKKRSLSTSSDGKKTLPSMGSEELILKSPFKAILKAAESDSESKLKAEDLKLLHSLALSTIEKATQTEGSTADGIQMMTVVAQNGHIESQLYLGGHFEFEARDAEELNATITSLGGDAEDDDGVAQRLQTEAVRWFRLAAAEGDERAQLKLAEFHQAGKGLAWDEKEAVWLLRRAAEKGLAAAQIKLALCYESGRGVKADESTAVSYYTMAANQGHAGAQLALGECFEHGRGVEKNIDEAAKYYKLSSKQGSSHASLRLSLLSKDLVTARKYQQKAMKNMSKLNLAAQQHALADLVLATSRWKCNFPECPNVNASPRSNSSTSGSDSRHWSKSSTRDRGKSTPRKRNLKVCSHCREVHYCSSQCLAQDWAKYHKSVCAHSVQVSRPSERSEKPKGKQKSAGVRFDK